MKKIITFLLLIVSLNLLSQENISIKGKLFFSSDFYRNFSNLLVKIDNAKEYVTIKEDGNFELFTLTKKENYKLLFYYGDIKFKEFDYKFEWTKRKRPKSISLADKCEVNKSVARNKFKEKKKLKIYVFNRLDSLVLTSNDLKFQKKTNTEFVKISTKNINKFECYLEYNQMVFKILYLSKNNNLLKRIRKDIIGYNYRFNIN